MELDVQEIRLNNAMFQLSTEITQLMMAFDFDSTF